MHISVIDTGRKRKGYIGTVSPVKKSKKGTDYTEFTFTSENDVERGVCFSSKVRKQLITHADSSRPVYVTNIGGTDDLIFTSSTVFEELQEGAVAFTKDSVSVAITLIVDITSLHIRYSYVRPIYQIQYILCTS